MKSLKMISSAQLVGSRCLRVRSFCNTHCPWRSPGEAFLFCRGTKRGHTNVLLSQLNTALQLGLHNGFIPDILSAFWLSTAIPVLTILVFENGRGGFILIVASQLLERTNSHYRYQIHWAKILSIHMAIWRKISLQKKYEFDWSSSINSKLLLSTITIILFMNFQ